jgi:anti-sigma factor RsiW
MNPYTDLYAGDDRHLEAQEALPWLANGTLAGTELERVQAHVETCAHCRADLAALSTMRAAGAATDLDFDPERALARLMPRLDRPAAADDAPAPCAVLAASKAPDAPGLLRRWRARLAANDGTWLRAAVAAQCAVIAVLAVLLARPAAVPEAPENYRALGASGANGMARLVVAFRPDTPERELRRIVRSSGARIVGGPTVTDAWLVGADGRLAPVLARLRAEPAVTLAEPLFADERP